MTREEAIQILADLIESPFLHTWEKQNKALHMAIEALSAEAVQIPIKLEKRYPESKDEDITDAFMRGYLAGRSSAEAVTHGRLIDADALSEKLCETTIFIKDGEAFQRMINDAPTVSAEAVQGEWEDMEIQCNPYPPIFCVECSACGYRVGRETFLENTFNFCPNCGARMKAR